MGAVLCVGEDSSMILTYDMQVGWTRVRFADTVAQYLAFYPIVACGPNLPHDMVCASMVGALPPPSSLNIQPATTSAAAHELGLCMASAHAEGAVCRCGACLAAQAHGLDPRG